VSIVAATLAAYALGLWAYAANHVLTRASYSLGDMRSPVRIAVVAMFVNLALNLILVRRLYEVGLGLATAVAATLQFALLARLVSGKTEGLGIGRLAASFFRTLGGCVVVGAVSWVASGLLAEPGAGKAALAARIFGAMAAAGVAYFVYALIVRAPELRDILSTARKKVVESPSDES